MLAPAKVELPRGVVFGFSRSAGREIGQGACCLPQLCGYVGGDGCGRQRGLRGDGQAGPEAANRQRPTQIGLNSIGLADNVNSRKEAPH
jgi:hypothetical protein